MLVGGVFLELTLQGNSSAAKGPDTCSEPRGINRGFPTEIRFMDWFAIRKYSSKLLVIQD